VLLRDKAASGSGSYFSTAKRGYLMFYVRVQYRAEKCENGQERSCSDRETELRSQTNRTELVRLKYIMRTQSIRYGELGSKPLHIFPAE
jgi:hypothetical protein